MLTRLVGEARGQNRFRFQIKRHDQRERESFVQGHKTTSDKARTCAQGFWFSSKVLPNSSHTHPHPQIARKILLLLLF